MLCDFISCAKSKTEEIENLVEKKIINYYFEKYDKNWKFPKKLNN